MSQTYFQITYLFLKYYYYYNMFIVQSINSLIFNFFMDILELDVLIIIYYIIIVTNSKF